MRILLIILFLGLVAVQCRDSPKPVGQKEGSGVKMENAVAKVPESWIKKRVETARERLSNSEAGKLVWLGMEAHGSLDNWYSNGPLSFHFNYQPLDGGTQRDTYQAIDTWRSRVRHFKAGDSTAQYGWDGRVGWRKAKDSTTFPYDVRFWALTPYYFAGLPFVLDGKGVNLEKLPAKNFNKITYNTVKVTFDAGTGDAPDDYYILYFHPESHKMQVIRYIVSYPAYFKKGEHMPEKFMELIGEQNINGILFPKAYKTYWLGEGELPGEHITNITLSEVAFLPDLEAAFFEVPEGAEIIDKL